VLRNLLEEGWIDHCAAVGGYFKEGLEGLARKHETIREVRGLGLILGVEMTRPCAEVVDACMDAGFLINCAHDTVLRFIPPLIVERAEIDALLEALDAILERI
jgi:acetylornithine/succinyldiaminopimelate/putrescine aminotransferase